MAEVRIVRRPAAEDDLIEIWCMVAPENPSAADRIVDSIAERIWQLATFPAPAPLRPDIGRQARALTIGSHVTLYRHLGETVEIVRIVHGARDLTALL